VRRIFHLGLILFALFGVASQSTAHVTAFERMATPMQMSSGSMSCGDETGQRETGKVPCKKVGLQCPAAIGCPAMTMAEPGISTEQPTAFEPLKSVPELADALHGRSYAPELEPPSALI
jgi:hypothetical protein